MILLRSICTNSANAFFASWFASSAIMTLGKRWTALNPELNLFLTSSYLSSGRFRDQLSIGIAVYSICATIFNKLIKEIPNDLCRHFSLVFMKGIAISLACLSGVMATDKTYRLALALVLGFTGIEFLSNQLKNQKNDTIGPS